MSYGSAAALRAALEHRLQSEAQETGVALNRLRRRVVFERIVSRIESAEPSHWVVKGGMALEVRLAGRARTTKDLDLGLREDEVDGAELRDRLIDALATDLDSDGFAFAVGPAAELAADEAGRNSWRFSVQASLAGRPFDGLKLDVAPRSEELASTERVTLRSSLSFAGIDASSVDLIDINRHAAEKIHAFSRTYGERPSSRVRDLVDLVLLIENDLLDFAHTATAIDAVFSQRATHPVPRVLPDPPAYWEDQYARLVADLTVEARTLTEALELLRRWWQQAISYLES
jgi:predicted nucleotidyltransferase component of viral defense system